MLPWEWTKTAASDFAASKGSPFFGIGLNNHYNYFDPTMVEEDARVQKLWPTFVPSKEDLDSHSPHESELDYFLFDAICTRVDMSVVSEVPRPIGDSVQVNHLDKISTYFKDFFISSTTSKKQLTLAKMGCNDGCASSLSVSDGYFKETFSAEQSIVRGIWEVKDNTLTPSEGLRQAISEGTNVTVSHLRHGIPWDQVMVPLVSSNGHLIQFGCIVLLEPSFPFMVVLSKVLDLLDSSDRALAVGYLRKLQSFLQKPLLESKSSHMNPELVKFGLSTIHYHTKPLKDFFCSKHDFDSSLQHYFRVMGHLHKQLGDKRGIVLFPVCVRVFDKEQQIVFPRLGPLHTSASYQEASAIDGSDYRIGLPATSSLRVKLLEAIIEAMHRIHDCNVAHLDFYLSNFMWKVDPANKEDIILKIIDWDSAHFCDELLSESVTQRLQLTSIRLPLAETVTECPNQATRLDISLVQVLKTFIDDEGLRSNHKPVIDRRFIELQKMYLKQFKP